MKVAANFEVTIPPDSSAFAIMVMAMLDHWQLCAKDQTSLLGIDDDNRSGLSNYRLGKSIHFNDEQYERVIHLLSIHKCLRRLFPQNRDLAYRWMTTKNKAFDNRPPLEVAKEQGIAGLLMVRSYLDDSLGA